MRTHSVTLVLSVFGVSSLVAGCLSAALGEGRDDEGPAAPNRQVQVDASSTGPTAAEVGELPPGPIPSLPDAGAPGCTLAGPPAATEGDTLVWSDEFSGNTLDPKKWYVHDGYEGHGTISNSFSPSALSVHDGLLHVDVRSAPTDLIHPYVSGRIETFGRFARTYGKIEFRARFPYAPGVWYAVWGRPQATAMPEIDVEVLGNNAGQAWFVNHWALPPIPADERRSYVTVATDVTQFHVYTIVWKPSFLEWQLDGKPFMTSTTKGVPTSPVAWTINGWTGGWGATTTTPPVPVTFQIDWLRVYRMDGLIADPELRVLGPKPSYTQEGYVDLEPTNFDEACFVVDVFEGETRLASLQQWPYRFSMKELTPGAHELSFVATDGQRSATTSLTLEVQ